MDLKVRESSATNLTMELLKPCSDGITRLAAAHTFSTVGSSLISEEIIRQTYTVTSLPWPHRQMYSCIREKGGRTSLKSPRRRVAKIPEFQKDNYYNIQSKMRGQ